MKVESDSCKIYPNNQSTSTCTCTCTRSDTYLRLKGAFIPITGAAVLSEPALLHMVCVPGCSARITSFAPASATTGLLMPTSLQQKREYGKESDGHQRLLSLVSTNTKITHRPTKHTLLTHSAFLQSVTPWAGTVLSKTAASVRLPIFWAMRFAQSTFA